jgi:hypothetical protein
VKNVTEGSRFEWIRTGRQQTPSAYSPGGVPLACIMPLKFERYAKILHRFNVSEDRIDPSLTHDELAILQISDCISIKQLIDLKPRDTRIFWNEAARYLEVPYSQEITHNFWAVGRKSDLLGFNR